MNETRQIPQLNSILLVDDDDTALFVAEKLLAKEGKVKTIHQYTSPVKALAMLHEISDKDERFPECILLDVKMPVMDAFGFLEKAEQLSGFTGSGCRVVLISSYYEYDEGPEIMEKAKNHPCITGFIEKPFSLEKLAELN
jgi:CheY-like chemotaxis protein